MLDIPANDVITLLTDVRRSLDTDGYDLDLVGIDDVIELRVVARPDVCEDCLVSKDIMRAIIAEAIADMYEDVNQESILLHYPVESAAH